MDYLHEITQSVFAAHLLDGSSGRALPGISVFGEVAVYSSDEAEVFPEIDRGWIDLSQVHVPVFRRLLREQLQRWFTGDEWRALSEDDQRRIVTQILSWVYDQDDFFQWPHPRQQESMSWQLAEMLGEPARQQSELRLQRTLPLGQLTTDHEGYVSFNPQRVAHLVGSEAVAVPLLRVGSPGAAPLRLLDGGRVTPDVVVATMGVRNAEGLPLSSAPTVSMQDPSLHDWYLSPGSFALPGHALIGEDGTENLLPADVARYDFTLRRVQKLSDTAFAPEPYKDAVVDEYEVTWFPIGHSLGKILSSVGLAPGESVKMAIIDWAWESSTVRGEATALDEQAMHALYRDRMITESMSASLDEWQRGGSFMAGHAGSAGGSAAYGPFGVAAGVSDAMGGAYSTSSGSRDLAGETAQKLGDSIAQSSSSRRDLQSAVVVQASQSVKETVQTRTYSNYNHAHTLNLLHYEILQHYRVSTRWVRRRPAVLVYRSLPGFTPTYVRQNRMTLEPFIPPEIATSGFAALEKHLQITSDDEIKKSSAPFKPSVKLPREFDLVAFEAWFKLGGEVSTNGVHLEARLVNGTTIPLHFEGDPNLNKSEAFNVEQTEFSLPLTPSGIIVWEELLGFDIFKNGETDLGIMEFGITAMGNFPVIELKPRGGPYLKFEDEGKRQFIATRPADPDPPAPPAPPTGRSRLSFEENGAFDRLMEHVEYYAETYHRLITLSRHPNIWAGQLDALLWGNSGKVIDHVAPWALETFGHMVAFERIDADGIDPELLAPPSDAPVERLVTLPTRGVFTEGKLGNGNIAEIIDKTRRWEWDENSIPITAPEIAPVTTATPTPQAVQVTPTAFPAPIVTITTAPDAPAPTGLAAALQALSTPGIFRDMSGREEVAALLKELSENTIEIADAANRAKEIQSKYGAELDKNASGVQQKAIEAASQVAQKEIESQAQARAAEARAKGAEASQQETKATQSQLEAAKDLPPSYRAPVYQAAAQQLSGNASKRKTIVFRALGFDGQTIDTEFSLTVRDVIAGSNVLDGVRVGGYGDKTVEFSTPAANINAVIARKGMIPIKILDTVVEITPISVVNADGTYAVAASHRIIDITLKQGATKVDFKASTTDQAVEQFMTKVGGELGIDKVVAAN